MIYLQGFINYHTNVTVYSVWIWKTNIQNPNSAPNSVLDTYCQSYYTCIVCIKSWLPFVTFIGAGIWFICVPKRTFMLSRIWRLVLYREISQVKSRSGGWGGRGSAACYRQQPHSRVKDAIFNYFTTHVRNVFAKKN